MTYSEYLLSEAIKPTVTEYGTDFKNEKWKNVGEGFYITHFKTDEYIYTYMIRDGFVGFFTSELEDENEILSKTNIRDILSDNNLFDKKSTHKTMLIFNHFFYLTLEAISYFNINEIKFDGADKALGDMYSVLVKNKKFNGKLEELGFEYKGLMHKDGRQFYLFNKKGN